MSNLQDLILQRENLKKSLKEIQKQIDVFELEKFSNETPFKIGDRVKRSKEKFEITEYRKLFGSLRLYGKKILKSGELGKATFELYGVLEKIEGQQ